MGAAWPESQPEHANQAAEEQFERLQDVVRALRNVRGLLEIPAGDRPQATVLCDSAEARDSMAQCKELTCFLARVESMDLGTVDDASPANTGTDVFRGGSVFLPFTEETDPAKLRSNLEKKMQKVEKGIKGIEGKLGNERFLANADPDVVASERLRIEDLRKELETLSANLVGLAD